MNPLPEVNTSIKPGIKGLSYSGNFQPYTNPNEPEDLQPIFLTDESRLPEIYQLRLKVWEQSGKCEFVNRTLYPNGWNDPLDEVAFHWIVVNPENEIIASARLNIFNTLEEFPYYNSVKTFLLPSHLSFGFFSRLVVHPHYSNQGLSRKLFQGRNRFCEEKKITWSQVFINNPLIINQFEKSGFVKIGTAEIAYHASAFPHSVNVFIKENQVP